VTSKTDITVRLVVTWLARSAAYALLIGAALLAVTVRISCAGLARVEIEFLWCRGNINTVSI
jgi:hypothetical protein